MNKRHHNRGLRKLCSCARRSWSKCHHPWHFNFKAPGGASYRLSLDKHVGHHIESKRQAEEIAADLRKEMRAGTFGQASPMKEMTLRQLADLYLERYVAVERRATTKAVQPIRTGRYGGLRGHPPPRVT